MIMRMNKIAYRIQLQENLEWLNKQKSTLESLCIREMLKYEIEHTPIYDHLVENDEGDKP